MVPVLTVSEIANNCQHKQQNLNGSKAMRKLFHQPAKGKSSTLCMTEIYFQDITFIQSNYRYFEKNMKNTFFMRRYSTFQEAENFL